MIVSSNTETMRHSLYYIIGIMAVALMAITACSGKGSQTEGDIPNGMARTRGDSLALAARFTGDFQHFLAVTDSLADEGELSPIRADCYRAVALFRLGQIDKSIECLRRAIRDDNPPAEDFWEYIHSGTNLVIMLNSQRNYDMAMRTTLRLIDKLKGVNSPLRAKELQTLYLCLGDTQMMLERLDEAADSYDEAYQWVMRTPNDSTCRPIAISIETLENIAVTHIDHHLDEAGVWVDRMDSLLAVYETIPTADVRELKIFRALVSLHRAQVCQMRGQETEAARHYAAYAESDYGQGLEGRINGCDYLMAARRYAEAADLYTQLDRFINEWGYDYDLETIGKNLLPKLRANYLAGRQDSALRVAMQIAEVYDTALVRQKRSESAELATIYDTQGKERQIVEQRSQKRFFVAVSILLAVILVAVIAIAVILFIKHRNERRKNIAIATQISEAMSAKEQLREQRQADAPADEPGDLASLSDEQLFAYLRTAIEREELFLDHNCDRQMLTERFSLPKERLGNAFVRGGGYDNVSAFINKLRLDYATQLMTDDPDLDVSQVSAASGFSSPGYFSTCFRKQFGLSPTEFRVACRSKSEATIDA